jgi:hypothetical protein
MSFSVKRNVPAAPFLGGEAGGLLQRGVIEFGAGDATGELPLQMNYVEVLLLTPITVTAGTPADADQRAYVNETTDSEGGFRVPSTGTVTIAQEGASPVAFRYAFLAIGR